MVQNRRALGLISGGLDSTLAARLLIEQGIEVRGIYFSTGFCITDSLKKRGVSDETSNLCSEALKVGEDLAFAVNIVDVSKEYLDVVTNPRWGYGKNANPCIDCRVMMFRKAKEMMEKVGADFVFSGEVIGQRPMTQHRPTLRQMEKQSGLDGYLLRPLSALKLAETEVERKGWVDRSKLKGFHGRTRRPQIELAKEFGLTKYPQPAGGCCFLTDPVYGRKFFDFIRNLPEGRKVTHEDFDLLTLGRHLRLSEKVKMIVGRNEGENNALENFASGRTMMMPVEIPGPTALIEGDLSRDELQFAAQIVARYSDADARDRVDVSCLRNGSEEQFTVEPLQPEQVAELILK